MHRTSSILFLGIFFSVLSACSRTDNNVGSLAHDGGATGGVSGTGGATGGTVGSGGATGTVGSGGATGTLGSGGATGGTVGSGGATGARTCTYKGITYAAGETFKDDCNTCTCGAIGDTLVRCTTMACLGTGGAPAGTGGAVSSTGGVSGTGGGVSGTGGRTSDGGTADVSEASYCALCVDETAARTLACPAQRPTTEAELRTVCDAYLRTGQTAVTVRLGDCGLSGPLPGCNPVSPDTTVSVLSVDFMPPSGLDCHYSRATGALVGQTVSSDTPHYCGRAYAAATSGVTNPWCTAGGANVLRVTCGSGIDGGVDGASDGVVDRASSDVSDAGVDGAVASACSACGLDELCVAYYDGTCHAMSTSCNKVSAETRVAILVNHERCFAKPIGNEVCGTRDGSFFWGCGEPPCLAEQETLVADINCYGP